jgi:hypothetical protein
MALNLKNQSALRYTTSCKRNKGESRIKRSGGSQMVRGNPVWNPQLGFYSIDGRFKKKRKPSTAGMTTERQTEGVGEKPPRILLQLSWSGSRGYVVISRRMTSRSMVHTLTTTLPTICNHAIKILCVLSCCSLHSSLHFHQHLRAPEIFRVSVCLPPSANNLLCKNRNDEALFSESLLKFTDMSTEHENLTNYSIER